MSTFQLNDLSYIEECSFGGCNSTIWRVLYRNKPCILKTLVVDDNSKQYQLIMKEVGYHFKLKAKANNIVEILGYNEEITNEPSKISVSILYEELNNVGVMHADRYSFSLSKVIDLGLDIATALLDMKNICNIFHRDIKLYNIYLRNDKFILGDLGCATEINTNQFYEPVGSPLFAAPEILNGNWNYDESIDVYSLCMSMFILLNKQPPFVKNASELEYEISIQRRIAGAKIPFLNNYDYDICKILQKGTDFIPQNRFKDLEEFIKELSRLKNKYSIDI